MEEAVAVFRKEYNRLNRAVYDGTLPRFPGVTLVDSIDLFAATKTRGEGPERELRPFILSTFVREELLLETVRHEVAHAAALLFDEDEGHGPAWQEHARRCGARQVPTLDPGDPLRKDWPTLEKSD